MEDPPQSDHELIRPALNEYYSVLHEDRIWLYTSMPPTACSWILRRPGTTVSKLNFGITPQIPEAPGAGIANAAGFRMTCVSVCRKIHTGDYIGTAIVAERSA